MDYPQRYGTDMKDGTIPPGSQEICAKRHLPAPHTDLQPQALK